jgi:hypothetical protein
MNRLCGSFCSPRCWIITAVVLVYFVMFPEDLERVLAPVRVVLSLTRSVSPWAYGLLAVIAICLTFGRRWKKPVPPAM